MWLTVRCTVQTGLTKKAVFGSYSLPPPTVSLADTAIPPTKGQGAVPQREAHRLPIPLERSPSIKADTTPRYDVECKREFQINPADQSQALCDDGLNQYECPAANCHAAKQNAKPTKDSLLGNDCQPLQALASTTPPLAADSYKVEKETKDTVINYKDFPRVHPSKQLPAATGHTNPRQDPHPDEPKYSNKPGGPGKVKANGDDRNGDSKIECPYKANKQSDIRESCTQCLKKSTCGKTFIIHTICFSK
ncbi:hypothetical protein O181_007739 [Austropuccinia psidii MF-1]|uniref:Uncharacterized protein n=1 Tax=Austropuccinia psidii MF-1 TaxID=1389203 RepID=A0A9Q3GI66_9BASI|nr:hypothetical protein [Austropuccinia psidii MF-1]